MKVIVNDYVKISYQGKSYTKSDGVIDMDAKTAKMYKDTGHVEYHESKVNDTKNKKTKKSKK